MERRSKLSHRDQIHGVAMWMMQCGWSDEEVINAFELEDQELIARNIADWRKALVEFQQRLMEEDIYS